MSKESKKEKSEKEDPLDSVFVDKNQPADRKLVADILRPLVTIDKEGTINFKAKYSELDESKKALVYLIAKKAMVLKEIENIAEESKNNEISEGANIKKKNVENTLYNYYKHLVEKGNKGYFIPNYNLKRVRDVLLGEKDE